MLFFSTCIIDINFTFQSVNQVSGVMEETVWNVKKTRTASAAMLLVIRLPPVHHVAQVLPHQAGALYAVSTERFC